MVVGGRVFGSIRLTLNLFSKIIHWLYTGICDILRGDFLREET
jgi:hypothetical protein